jgi:hypothetical protein
MLGRKVANLLKALAEPSPSGMAESAALLVPAEEQARVLRSFEIRLSSACAAARLGLELAGAHLCLESPDALESP